MQCSHENKIMKIVFPELESEKETFLPIHPTLPAQQHNKGTLTTTKNVICLT